MSAHVVDWEPGTPSRGRAVVAVGVFDGVHVGHQALVRDAVARARSEGVLAAVLTFDRDPDQVVTPDSAAAQLITAEDKVRFLLDLGPDVVLMVPFCRRMAETAPDRFVTDVLMEAFEPLAVVVGLDFRFGRYASGDIRTLERAGRGHGFEVVAHDLVEADGAPVTSTRIRALVACGDVYAAAKLLGRRHRVTGLVHHGRGQGGTLGVPTANVLPEAYAAVPADGVYAGVARTGTQTYPAGISVGVPPTFPEAHDHLEAHLIGFEGDLYGEQLTIEFAEKLRDHRAFHSPQALSTEIREDLAEVLRLVGE